MEINDDQLLRYARHVILDEVGEEGQAKLLRSRVLVIGAGGLGAPLLMYLAAAGVGTLGVVDDDVVEISNLQRQIVHGTSRLGVAKVESAAETLAAINPEVEVVPVETRVTADNVLEMIAGYDVIADGSDNFATRYLMNDACFLSKKTLVAAALLRFDGQISTFKAHLGGGNPCYRCVFREPPPANMIPRCEEAGIFGAIAGVMGSLQAAEVIKEILGLGDSLSGRLLMYDGLTTAFRTIRIKRDPDCPLCGGAPTITDLSIHGG